MNVSPKMMSAGSGNWPLDSVFGVNPLQSPRCWTPVTAAPFQVVRSREQYPVVGAFSNTTDTVLPPACEGVTVVGMEDREHSSAVTTCCDQLSIIPNNLRLEIISIIEWLWL